MLKSALRVKQKYGSMTRTRSPPLQAVAMPPRERLEKKMTPGSSLVCLTIAASLALPTVSLAAETRCGWLDNPTPQNWWLQDKQKSWTIMTQDPDRPDGAEGMEMIPDLSEGEFVEINGSYGYACACMSVETDGDERITKILSVQQLKLAQCQNDKALESRD
jgi:hypothetical protein